jgi:hypothetical protein
MDNPEKLATQGTQDEDKQNKNSLFISNLSGPAPVRFISYML